MKDDATFLIVCIAGIALLAGMVCFLRQQPERAPAPVQVPPAPPAPDRFDRPAAALLELHNAERQKAGRAPLVLNFDLMDYARQHAKRMATSRRLYHSDLQIPGFTALGENIAWNQQTPAAAVADWMGSTGHRRNMLSASFNVAGFGVAESSNGPYWCAVFGRR